MYVYIYISYSRCILYIYTSSKKNIHGKSQLLRSTSKENNICRDMQGPNILQMVFQNMGTVSQFGPIRLSSLPSTSYLNMHSAGTEPKHLKTWSKCIPPNYNSEIFSGYKYNLWTYEAAGCSYHGPLRKARGAAWQIRSPAGSWGNNTPGRARVSGHPWRI